MRHGPTANYWYGLDLISLGRASLEINPGCQRIRSACDFRNDRVLLERRELQQLGVQQAQHGSDLLTQSVRAASRDGPTTSSVAGGSPRPSSSRPHGARKGPRLIEPGPPIPGARAEE